MTDTHSSRQWVSRTRLVDEVADELRTRIYTAEYPVGTRLRQVELSDELGVSRTPLREALRMLEVQGLVTVVNGGGVQVVSPTTEMLLDAYRVREVVDGLAARLAAEVGGSTTDFDAFLEEQAHCLRQWDAAAWTQANVGLHGAVIEAAANPYLTNQMSIVRLTAQVFVPLERVDASRAERAFVEHRSIVEAIREGNEDEAERRARLHIKTTLDAISAGALEAEAC